MDMYAALWSSTVKEKFEEMGGVLEGYAVYGGQQRQSERRPTEVDEGLQRRRGLHSLFIVIKADIVRVHRKSDQSTENERIYAPLLPFPSKP